MRYYLGKRADLLSIANVRENWKAAEPFWNAIPIGRVDEGMAIDYRQRRSHCAAVTVRNELAVIRAALNLAAKDRMIERAPFVPMPKLPTAGIRHLTQDQFRKLIAGSESPHLSLFMTLAVATGARMTALLELTWAQVDFDRGIIDLNPAGRIQTSKGRATVPINAKLRDALLTAQAAAETGYVIEYAGRRVNSVKTAWNAAARRSGIKATPHMLRHTAAVWMAEATVPMEQIAAFLGHTDSRITSRVYARFSPTFLRCAAEALTW